MSFPQLRDKIIASPKGSKELFVGRLLAIDPGETTGYAIFENGELQDEGQFSSKVVSLHGSFIAGMIEAHKIERVILESYAVFSWKSEQHIHDDLHTARVIGAIEYVCSEPLKLTHVPLVKQSPRQGKDFCKDDKLRMWGYYRRGQKHARDAIRHGCHYLLFSHLTKDEVPIKDDA